MNDADTTKKMDNKPANTMHDWSALDAMTAEEKHAAAMSDPDNLPLTEEDFKRMKRTPHASVSKVAATACNAKRSSAPNAKPRSLSKRPRPMPWRPPSNGPRHVGNNPGVDREPFRACAGTAAGIEAQRHAG